MEAATASHLDHGHPERLSRAERHALLADLVRRERELAAAKLDLLDVMDAEGDHVPDGHRTMANLLTVVSNCDPASARTTMRAVRTLRLLPKVRRQLASGAIGLAQVRTLAAAYRNPRVRGVLDAVEDQLLDWAEWEWTSFDRCIRELVRLADADGATQHARDQHHHRGFHHHATPDGTYHGTHSCGPAQGAAIGRILDHFEQHEFDTDWADAATRLGRRPATRELARTAPQRRMDAFHAMCLAAAAATPGLRPPAPLVNVVIDARTYRDTVEWATTGRHPAVDLSDVASRRCHTTDGVPVPAADVLAAVIDGHTRRVVTDHGVTIDLGRRRRLYTGNARDAVMLRATHCIWPGCTTPTTRCEADHATPWMAAGRTDAQDGAPLCGRHNHWKTSGYRTHHHPDTDTWRVHRPDGTAINDPPAS